MAKISMVLGAGCALESLTWYGGRHSSYIFHSTGYKHSLMIMRQKHLLRSSTQCTRTNPSNLWHVQSKVYWGSSTLCLAPSCVLVSVKYSFTRCLSPYMPIKRLPKCTHPEQILKYTWVLLLGGDPSRQLKRSKSSMRSRKLSTSPSECILRLEFANHNYINALRSLTFGLSAHRATFNIDVELEKEKLQRVEFRLRTFVRWREQRKEVF